MNTPLQKNVHLHFLYFAFVEVVLFFQHLCDIIHTKRDLNH